MLWRIHAERTCTHAHSRIERDARTQTLTDTIYLQVQSVKIAASESRAAAQLAETISLKAKGVDGEYTSNLGRTRPNY